MWIAEQRPNFVKVAHGSVQFQQMVLVIKRFDLWVEWDMNDQFVKTIVAENIEEAHYVAECYVAEHGIDREYEYRGYLLDEQGDAVCV